MQYFRLTKDKRVNFVKTDFSLWVDEDEQNGVAVDDGFASTGAPPGAGKNIYLCRSASSTHRNPIPIRMDKTLKIYIYIYFF
jgi:hypothetical protein